MRLGMFMQPVHETERDVHRTLLEDVEVGAYCAEVGMDEFWVGEHYTNKTQNITSAAVFLANLIARSDKMKLGAAVVPMPVANPGYTAAHMALLDHLSEGRVIVGFGIGACPTDFEMYKAVDLYPMLKEGVLQTIALWKAKKGPFHVKGEYWDFELGEERLWPEYGIGEMLEPYQKPHPPVAIPCISPNSESVRFAGENGFIAITAQLNPAWIVADHWKTYVEGCERSGHRPDPASWRVARAIYVDESDAAAEDYVQGDGNTFDFYYSYLTEIIQKLGYGKIILPEDGRYPSPGGLQLAGVQAGQPDVWRSRHDLREAPGLLRGGAAVRHAAADLVRVRRCPRQDSKLDPADGHQCDAAATPGARRPRGGAVIGPGRPSQRLTADDGKC